MTLSRKLFLSSLSLLMVVSSKSFAAGYSTGLTSTSGLANSYAGSATGIHDSSDMFFNPAILSDIKNNQFISSLSYLKLDIDADHTKSGFTNSGTEVRDAGVDGFVPAFYLAAPINNEATFGLAINSPFGLATKYNKDWTGRYHGIESSVATLNINPSLSYKINEQLSLGAGLQAQYYKAKFTKAIFGGTADYFGKSEGSDWGYGYNLGANYKVNDKLKVGIGYRSKIDHTLKGDTTTNIPNHESSKFKSDATTPESITVGTSFKANDKLELAYDMTWTRWSRLKSLIIDNQDPVLNAGNTTNFSWHDSFLHSVGANYQLCNKWLLRTGLAYEKDATADSTREPRIPTGDRVWTTIGFGYKISNDFSVDSAFAHQFYKASKVDLSSSTAGNFQGTYHTTVNVLSIALKKEF